MTGTDGFFILIFLKNQNWQFSESEIFRYPKLAVINKIKNMIGMNLVQIILCKMGHVTPQSCEKVIPQSWLQKFQEYYLM
jgi:hypothetical protein